jgi:hypothetical protein
MSTELTISIDQVKSLISNLEPEEIKVFDIAKIIAFISSIEEHTTVYKLAKGIDVENLVDLLSLIDVFYNSQKTNDKMQNIFYSVESNFCVDFFALHMGNLEWTHE